MPDTRRLLLAALVACGSVLLAGPAHAGTGKDADKADLVFTGTVTEVGGTDKLPSYAVEADRIWKGTLTMPSVDLAQTSKACALDLKVDQDYVFFVTQDGTDLVSGDCAGTTKATDALTSKLDDLLGDSQAVDPGQPEQPAAEFTQVEGAEPEAFTRLAAPGGALVLLGVLGLVVVGLAGRRPAR